METGVLLSDFAQQLRREYADVPDSFLILLETAGMSPTLVLKQNAKVKERGSWIAFKKGTTEAAKIVHVGCYLWVFAQFSEN